MRRLFAAGVALGAVLSGGCPPCQGGRALLAEDWEGCDSTCGWAGEGGLEVVSTVHSAEHGLSMDAGTVATKAYDASLPLDGGLSLRLLASCSGAALAVTLTWESEGGDLEDQAVRLLGACGGEDGEDAPFTALCAELAGGRPDGAVRLRAITLQAGSSCVVDRLVLAVPIPGACG